MAKRGDIAKRFAPLVPVLIQAGTALIGIEKLQNFWLGVVLWAVAVALAVFLWGPPVLQAWGRLRIGIARSRKSERSQRWANGSIVEPLSKRAFLACALTALVLVFVGGVVFARYMTPGATTSTRLAVPLPLASIIQLDDDWEKYPLNEVSGRIYANETVVLDGFSFKDCRWDDVTLVYNGTAPTVFDCDWKQGGKFQLRTENPAIKMMLRIMSAFEKATGGAFRVGDVKVRPRAPWERQ